MKTPIALLVTDTHLSEHNVELVTDIWRQAIDKCKELKLLQIIFGGDFFHSRKGQPLATLKAAQNILMMLENSDIKVTAICGNHDKSAYDSKDSFVDIFDSEYFNVVNEYRKVKYGNIIVHLLPYFKESGSYLERLENINTTDGFKNILITHIAINGSITNDNEHISNCIPSSEFDRFDLAISGHFHNRQEFENIVYMGSAYQANYGEDDSKGFTVLHDDGSYEFTQAKFPKYIKKTIEIDQLHDLMIDSELLHLSEDNHVRVELTGNSEQLKSFNRSILSDLGIDSVLKPHGAIESLKDCNVTSHDKESIRGAFKSFCEEIKVEQTNYAIEKLEEI